MWKSDLAHHLKYWTIERYLERRQKKMLTKAHVDCSAKQTPTVGHTDCATAWHAHFSFQHKANNQVYVSKIFPLAVYLDTFNVATEHSNSIKLMLSEGKPFNFSCIWWLENSESLFKGEWPRGLMLCCPVACISSLCCSIWLCLCCFHSCLICHLSHSSWSIYPAYLSNIMLHKAEVGLGVCTVLSAWLLLNETKIWNLPQRWLWNFKFVALWVEKQKYPRILLVVANQSSADKLMVEMWFVETEATELLIHSIFSKIRAVSTNYWRETSKALTELLITHISKHVRVCQFKRVLRRCWPNLTFIMS